MKGTLIYAMNEEIKLNEEEGKKYYYNQLNDQQKEIVDFFGKDNNDVKRWIVVNGGPGCGKSYVIRALAEQLMEIKQIDELTPFLKIVAPTNCASFNVGGKTLHETIKGGGELIHALNKLDADRTMNNIWSNKNIFETMRRVKKYLRVKGFTIPDFEEDNFLDEAYVNYDEATLVVLFDETSMISLPLFFVFLCKFEAFLKRERYYFFFFGDRNQLKPISKVRDTLYDLFKIFPEKVREFNLSINVRNAENSYFAKFIEDWWDPNRDCSELANINFGGDEEDFIHLRHPKIAICGKREDVHRLNSLEVNRIEGTPVTLTAKIEIEEEEEEEEEDDNDVDLPREKIVRDDLISIIAKKSVLPHSLTLKPRIPVILLKTIEKPFLYTNRVLEFVSYDKDGDKVTLASKEDEWGNVSGKEYVIRRFEDEIFHYDNEGNAKLIGCFSQFPFDIFYAVTVHRVQGLTLNYPTLVKYNSFWKTDDLRLSYVATSRVTTPGLLYYDIHPFNTPRSLIKYREQNFTSSHFKRKKID